MPDIVAPATPGLPRLVDRYELVAVIGRGGSGPVYRAVDTRLGKTVAMKTASASRQGARLSDRVRQRFLREAMALSKVDHRNVVQVLDYGFADDGTPFVVMEHLRGRDLAALLALGDGPLPVADVADIGLGVCAALRACHRVGIIHRDLKPGNVFLAEGDRGFEVKVLDFGVSRAVSDDDRTREGQSLVVSHHLAPEQIDGRAGPASDQYALGVLLHVCLTRRFPALDGRAAIRRIDLPPPVQDLLARATRLAPAERFESVFALGRQLLPFASPRAHAQWCGYYDPPRRAPRTAMQARTPPGPTRAFDGGPTLVESNAAFTETKLSRSREGNGRIGAPGSSHSPWIIGWLDWRAASIGCVALAATGLASGRRRPPRTVAPQPAVARRLAVTELAAPRHPPVRAPHPAAAAPVPPAAAPPIVVRVDVPAPGSHPEPHPARERTPRAASHAPSAELLPNIDRAGIGIPTE